MRNIAFCASSVALSILLLAAPGAMPAQGAGKPPNIVLFLADDQGWTGTSVRMDERIADSASDYYRTPSLQRLVREGMRFSNAYAPHPNCSPTRMSIQTGKSPARLGSYDIIDVAPGSFFYEGSYVNRPLSSPLPITDLPAGETTIAEFIKRNLPEYSTAHFGKWHMGGGGPERNGYDAGDGATKNREGMQGAPDPKRINSITERACKFMADQVAGGKPFYLQISHYAVHTPIRAMPETVKAYEARPAGTYQKNTAYGAMTENLDEGLGKVLAKIDELGISDNTCFIYTSDNGGEIMNDVTSNLPLAKGKTHVWEGGVRVPLVVRGPGIKPGSVSNVPAIGWDFFPTIADWLGIKAPLPANLDGGSLRKVLENGGVGTVPRPGKEFVWYFPGYRVGKGVYPQAAIRSGNYKLIKEFEKNQLYLYDLAADIGETHNLAEQMPDHARAMDQRLEGYLNAVGAKRPLPNPDYDPTKVAPTRPGRRRGGAGTSEP